ncbi:hypothetical protein BJ085DRAFT_42260 [Dimargaris cristalligena]|uniref:RRM domain-containing protein n=1 Tax=Dimargaris cristalligena TaxID=215637 RepID=A0A4P9ZP47_9FUNG|nr:hypothetical protein BJ085DRAFT_42260 [Dimargaris cristalligena]|eukprot:RKP35214.1 hypothetical protein BJ085DRAFT_42260 [Dimargaris cristalligena]
MSRRCTLFVAGFSPSVRARDLAYEFERYGRLVRCDIPAPRPGSNRVFAFIEYEDPRDADDAYNEMHGRRVDGSPLSIQWAKNAPNTAWRSGGGGGGRRSPSYRRSERSPRRLSRSPSPRRSMERRRPRSRSYSQSPPRRSASPGHRYSRSPPPEARGPSPGRRSSRSPSPRARRDRSYSRSQSHHDRPRSGSPLPPADRSRSPTQED